jgi:S-adenosylmethionine:tRNA ribosyltransferase-isomerase
LRVELFDFELPEALIALRPAVPRESARLLVVDPAAAAELADHRVAELADFLRAGDVVVLNDTRVIPARLLASRLIAGALSRARRSGSPSATGSSSATPRRGSPASSGA